MLLGCALNVVHPTPFDVILWQNRNIHKSDRKKTRQQTGLRKVSQSASRQGTHIITCPRGKLPLSSPARHPRCRRHNIFPNGLTPMQMGVKNPLLGKIPFHIRAPSLLHFRQLLCGPVKQRCHACGQGTRVSGLTQQPALAGQHGIPATRRQW